ncbi:MAG: iron ABC transporter permease [Alphaproteobacteria bacterium]|nr:iron ABC transporter permease [Alphaproteobacteria bacterium]
MTHALSPGRSRGAGDARALAACIAAAAAIAVLVLLALSVGRYPVPPGALVAVLTGSAPAEIVTVVWQIRLPRIAGALAVGAALAAAGAAYQAMFRNPLVAPDILGVSSGAGLGAVLGIVAGAGIWEIQLASFAGGLCAVGLVYIAAAAVPRGDPTLVLVLAGVVVGALFHAGIALATALADPYTELPAITFWLLGSLAGATRADMARLLPLVLVALVPLVLLRWRINVMSLGDEEASALGVPVAKVRMAAIAAATLMTAAAVASAGVVGWVGLVVPHAARLIVGPGFGRLLPLAALLGAGYMLAIDTLARSLVATELPLGVLTAVVGAPVFLLLLARARRVWS